MILDLLDLRRPQTTLSVKLERPGSHRSREFTAIISVDRIPPRHYECTQLNIFSEF